MYKVRTSQVEVPFEDLNVEARHTVLSVQDAVEEAVAQLRREAQQVLERDEQRQNMHEQRPSIPKLLPAPVLLPTAYSIRKIYPVDLTSSPEASTSPNRLPMLPPASTPRRNVQQLSSPPSSAEREGIPSDRELTSSVVKGRVAEGLLGLRHAI